MKTPKKMLLERAKNMRKKPTEAERQLWIILRDSRLQNYKFRRQQIIGSYIVDFVCLRQQLVVEADGGQHNEMSNHRYDEKRKEFLRSEGFDVLRFWNNDIHLNPEGVVESILNALLNKI